MIAGGYFYFRLKISTDGKIFIFILDFVSDKDLADVVPTVGFEPQKFNYRSYNLTINDLGGGERVRDLWKHYMAESYGFIYVLDSSNRKRIEETKKEFTKFLNNPKVSGKPVLL